MTTSKTIQIPEAADRTAWRVILLTLASAFEHALDCGCYSRMNAAVELAESEGMSPAQFLAMVRSTREDTTGAMAAAVWLLSPAKEAIKLLRLVTDRSRDEWLDYQHDIALRLTVDAFAA